MHKNTEKGFLNILNTRRDRGKERGEKRRKEGKGVGKRWRRIKGKMYLAHIRYTFINIQYLFIFFLLSPSPLINMLMTFIHCFRPSDVLMQTVGWLLGGVMQISQMF